MGLFLLGLLFGSVPLQAGAEEAATSTLEARLQNLVDAAAEDPDTPGVLLAVVGEGIDWAGASGVADLETGTPLESRAPARIASNTKTYVAASTLRLAEKGLIELDEPIASRLSEEVVRLLASDGYEPGKITIRHLLSHSSGLADHASTAQYLALVESEPQRRWIRREQVEGLVRWTEPVAAPGVRFSYSDTGYVLLGAILEAVSEQPLALAVRNLVGFDRLGLRETWWEDAEPRPVGTLERAHQYLGTVDTHSWDPSIDLFGGGGLVATAGDVARFWLALFEGEVFEKPETLAALLTSPLESGAYRMGLAIRHLEEGTLYEHAGFWGSRAGYVPELGLAFAAILTQQTDGERRAFELIREAIRIVARWRPCEGCSESPSAEETPPEHEPPNKRVAPARQGGGT